jgi:FixJ family two-component response regulator
LSPVREKVFVVDDDPVVRKTLSRLLRISGFECTSFESAEALLADFDLDSDDEGCAILDVEMPGLDGLGLQEALLARGSVLPILFLTGRGDVPASVRAMKAGASDFLTKPVEDTTLLAAVRQALARGRSARSARSGSLEARAKLATLTPREREVLDGVIAGRLNKQIAADLGITEATVKVHRGRVMEKAGVESVADLVRLVEKAGRTA